MNQVNNFVHSKFAAWPKAPWYRRAVVRLFLAVWLAAFAVQSTDLLASVLPDDCVEDTRGSGTDPCSENCARCVCCTRLPVFVPQVLVSPAREVLVDAEAIPLIAPATTAHPRGVLHVPKAL